MGCNDSGRHRAQRSRGHIVCSSSLARLLGYLPPLLLPSSTAVISLRGPMNSRYANGRGPHYMLLLSGAASQIFAAITYSISLIPFSSGFGSLGGGGPCHFLMGILDTPMVPMVGGHMRPPIVLPKVLSKVAKMWRKEVTRLVSGDTRGGMLRH